MGRVPFIQGSSTAETPEAKFKMLSTQIKDHLFPKVAAETTLVQSKRFYKTEKIHYKNTQRGEVDWRWGGTPQKQPDKEAPSCCHLGISETGSQESPAHEGTWQAQLEKDVGFHQCPRRNNCTPFNPVLFTTITSNK